MGALNKMSKIKNVKVSEKDSAIDDLVESNVAENEKWDKEISVVPKLLPTSIRLSTRTIERAKFFARIHHARGYQTWLKALIEERVNTEYEIYRKLKNEDVA
jgi:hypothetical protein